MEHIQITKEMIQNAKDYIPLLEKQRLSEELAQRCLVKVKMAFALDEGGEANAIPDRYQERREMTAMLQMGVFVSCYLGIPYAGDTDFQMAANEYDRWASSHIFNQLERMKSDKDIKDKVFDILDDYKDFQWAMRREIEILLGHRNDTVMRLGIFIAETGRKMALESSGEWGNGVLQNLLGGQNKPEDTAEKVAAAKEKIERLSSATAALQEAKEALAKAQNATMERKELTDKLNAKTNAKKPQVE